MIIVASTVIQAADRFTGAPERRERREIQAEVEAMGHTVWGDWYNTASLTHMRAVLVNLREERRAAERELEAAIESLEPTQTRP